MKRTLIVLFVFSGIALATLSCKHSKEKSRTSCSQLPANENISLRIGDVTVEEKVWYHNNSARSPYRMGTSYVTAADLSKVLYSFLPSTDRNEKDAAVVIYTNKYYSGADTTVVLGDIAGYGVYRIKDHKLRHMFYLKEQTGFTNIPELNVEVRGISSNMRYDIAALYFLDKYPHVFAFDLIAEEHYSDSY